MEMKNKLNVHIDYDEDVNDDDDLASIDSEGDDSNE